MKKVAKWLGVFAVVVCLGLAMTACGGKLEGKYSRSVKDEEDGYTTKMVIELKSDDKCTISTSYKDVPEELAAYMKDASIEGTYKIDGDTITISYGIPEVMDVTMEGTIKKGKSITITKMNGEAADDGEEIVFKR